MRLLSQLFLVGSLSTCHAFKYESTKQLEVSAPNTLCASGIPGGLLGPCPQTQQEVDNYDAIVMDEHGYVDVTISGLYFTNNNDGRRLEEGLVGDGGEKQDGEAKKVSDSSASTAKDSSESSDEAKGENNPARSSSNQPNNDHSTKSQAKNSSELNWVSPKKFHIQVYLVSISMAVSPSSIQTQHGVTSDHESDFISHLDFITDNGLCCYEYKDQSPGKSELLQQCNPMDMRPLVPRVGANQILSAPLSITTSSMKQEISVSARFRPTTRGRYMVVISNCAAILGDDGKATPLTAHIKSIKFKFASKFGELPLSMSGIVPFYGVLLAMYGILGIIWFRRSKGVISCLNGRDFRCLKSSNASGRVQARPLLGLQRAIYSLILLQFVFTLVAFSYYVHLNITVVDIDILYGGTMAALAGITPFSILVGTVHFITFLACQAVVMLATDGTWLIQSNIRPDTKKALYVLGAAWACFFATNTLLSRKVRLIIISSLGIIWAAFLVFNVRRSLRHLRSLILGQSNETVVAVGGNLVAKRSMYRKFFAVLAIYPIVFAVGVIWNVESQEDSWAWVGYVLVDVYVFIILLHASITWLPRPFAAMEYAKYTPLDHPKSSSSINDPTVWEEDINYSFDDIELS